MGWLGARAKGFAGLIGAGAKPAVLLVLAVPLVLLGVRVTRRRALVALLRVRRAYSTGEEPMVRVHMPHKNDRRAGNGRSVPHARPARADACQRLAALCYDDFDMAVFDDM